MEVADSTSSEQLSPTPQSFTQSPSVSQIEFKPGGAWVRYWASFIDDVILGIPAILCTFAINAIIGSPVSFKEDVMKNLENNIVFGITVLLFYFVYYVYLTAKKGATLGKDAYGLQVVKYNTRESISYSRAFIRELAKVGWLAIPILGSLIYLLNGLVILFSSDKRGIHDRIASTQVLKIKEPWPMKRQWGCSLVVIIGLLVVFGLGWLLFKTSGR